MSKKTRKEKEKNRMEQVKTDRWRRKLPEKYRNYTVDQMKAECDEFYRQIDQLIENGSSLEEMEAFLNQNEALIRAGQLFTIWSKEQIRKMLEAKKD